MQLSNEADTLRLVTLRRLVRGTCAVVVPRHVSAATIAHRVRAIGATHAVVVDDAQVVCGVIAAAQVTRGFSQERADAVMSERFVVMAPEDDADEAVAALDAAGAERVVVVAHDGELLGVLDAPRSRAASDERERVSAITQLASAFAMRPTPSWMFSIEHAYDSRTKPGAPKPEPGTTATLPTSTSQSHSCDVVVEDRALGRLLADVRARRPGTRRTRPSARGT